MQGTNTESGVFAKLALAAVARPGITVLVYVLLAVLGLVLSLSRLDIDTDPGRMISTDLPFRQHFAELNRTFPQFDNLFIVVIDDADPKTARAAAKSIASAFAGRPELFASVLAPGTDAFFDTSGVLYLDRGQIADLVARLKEARPAFLTLSQRSNLDGMDHLYDLLLLGAETDNLPDDAVDFLAESLRTVIGAPDGTAHAFNWEALGWEAHIHAPSRWYVLAKPVLDFTALEPAAKPMAEARRILADPAVNPLGPEQARLTGEAAVNAEELNTVTQGAALAGLVSFVLVTIVIYFGIPHKRFILPVLAVLGSGILIDAGFAAIAIGHLNMISVAFAVLFIGLGIDYAVHFTLRFAEAWRKGTGFEDAVGRAAAGVGPALFLCTLTTSFAFLVFTLTDFTGMAQLGMIAAAGIVIAFLASLTLIPALLTFIRLPHRADDPAWTPPVPLIALARVRPALSGLVIVLAAASVFAVPYVRFDGDPINLKNPEEPTVAVFNDLIKTNPDLIYAAQIIASRDEDVDGLARRLEALGTVRQVNSIETFLPTDQGPKLEELSKLSDIVPPKPEASAFANDDAPRNLDNIITNLSKLAALETASDAVRAAARELARAFSEFRDDAGPTKFKALEAAFMANVPGMFDRLQAMARLEPVTLEALPESIRRHYIAEDGRRRLEVVPSGDMRNETEMRAFVSEISVLAPNVTGAPVEITGAAATVAAAMRTAGVAAMLLVGLLLLAVLRNVRDVALVLLPFGLATLLLLAYTVVLDAPLNFANIIVLPLLLGLGVDSAIHYVMRLREDGYRNDIGATSTPRAVMLSALTTVGSFGSLWISRHLGLSSMGELLTVSIALMLVCTLIVLPQVVRWTIARGTVRA